MSRKTLANRIDLGMTRIAGYTLFDELTKEFQELTPKEVKNLIKHGEVNGLKLVNGEIELDTEEFNIRNLMIKSACGKFRTLYPTTSMVNCMYSVVRVIETDNGRIYETINNKSARVKVTPEKLKMLMEIANIAGVKMGADGKIEICKGVTIEDKRTQIALFDRMNQTDVKEFEHSLTGINIAAEKDLSGEGDKTAAEKSAESMADVTTDAVVRDDNGLEIVFDNIDVSEVHAEVNTTSDATSINPDNAEGNEDNSPPKEPIKEKKTTTPRKTKKK